MPNSSSKVSLPSGLYVAKKNLISKALSKLKGKDRLGEEDDDDEWTVYDALSTLATRYGDSTREREIVDVLCADFEELPPSQQERIDRLSDITWGVCKFVPLALWGDSLASVPFSLQDVRNVIIRQHCNAFGIYSKRNTRRGTSQNPSLFPFPLNKRPLPSFPLTLIHSTLLFSPIHS
eukprot:CAMPEP_0201511928 /NCGR_PEP_ID=MMETSP0161_2-20130828/4298_1 /ASSEMBLY_ACC=CAM_ASM_000251 /TAXON_ID=180227 /ORGANISM="Neoparamoeba aestuarina, Strain SoJaBio B1-5/56/2" /LENGTH=177 /DNA_ID=CAMNT_0047907599 /DNA_START=374 /DNA_END=908 /DNA_ORIENTATION=-